MSFLLFQMMNCLRKTGDPSIDYNSEFFVCSLSWLSFDDVLVKLAGLPSIFSFYKQIPLKGH